MAFGRHIIRRRKEFLLGWKFIYRQNDRPGRNTCESRVEYSVPAHRRPVFRRNESLVENPRSGSRFIPVCTCRHVRSAGCGADGRHQILCRNKQAGRTSIHVRRNFLSASQNRLPRGPAGQPGSKTGYSGAGLHLLRQCQWRSLCDGTGRMGRRHTDKRQCRTERRQRQAFPDRRQRVHGEQVKFRFRGFRICLLCECLVRCVRDRECVFQDELFPRRLVSGLSFPGRKQLVCTGIGART